MTQEQHPITPPPELVQQWLGTYFGSTVTGEVSDVELALATQAARWGADQELDACCEWLQDPDLNVDTYKLCAARRSKPPSLKEKASQIVDCLVEGDCLNDDDAITLRQVVESLPS